jgi:short-subunit dehydrogenase
MSGFERFAHRYGPWALVTGASSGIGEQFARLLAARGIHLVLCARRVPLLETLAARLRAEHGIEVELVAADLARQDFLPPLLEACAGRDVGLVVSNAGFGLKGENQLIEADRLTQMLNVNSHAPMLLAHAFAPRLLARGRGGFLFTGSIEAFRGFPWSSAYAGTKAFVTIFGEGLWGELKGRGVDVLVLSPGATDTASPVSQGIDRRALVGLMQPARVAEQALARLGKEPVFVPGWTNRLLVALFSGLPRTIAVRLAGWGMRRAIIAPNLPPAAAGRSGTESSGSGE